MPDVPDTQPPDLERVCGLVRGGEIHADLLVPLLSASSVEARLQANAAIADAYLAIGNPKQAEPYADRAFLLSGFSEAHAQRYLSIKRSLGDAQAAREAWKRLGMQALDRDDLSAAIGHFNASHYARSTVLSLDEYDYDHDIHARLDRVAESYRPASTARKGSAKDRRSRIAYLVFGASHPESVLIKMLCYFAKWHDRQRFEVAFFVPDPVLPSESGDKVRRANIAKLEQAGATVIAVQSGTIDAAIKETCASLTRFSPDVFVTTAALADYSHYLIAASRPAPIIAGLSFGVPQQYIPPLLDLAICTNVPSTLSAPCEIAFVPIEVLLPNAGEVVRVPRAALDVPEEAVLIACAGRPTKFRDDRFWRFVAGVLEARPNAWFAIIGMQNRPATFDECVPMDLRDRVRFTGWRQDYQKLLRTADIVLDTFPAGGGVTLLDAMALKIPIVAFKNDDLKDFSSADWSVAGEFIDNEDLVVRRGDFVRLKQAMLRLIDDPTHRARMGEWCADHVHSTRGSPERMVRAAEIAYMNARPKAVPSAKGRMAHELLGRLRRSGKTATNIGIQFFRWALRPIVRFFLGTRIGITLIRASFKPVIALARWKLGIVARRRGNVPYTCARVAAYVNSGSRPEVLLRPLLSGLPPTAYRLILGPDPVVRSGRSGTIPRFLHVPFAILRRCVTIARALQGENADALVVCSESPSDTIAQFWASQLLGCRFGLYLPDRRLKQETDLWGRLIRTFEDIIAAHLGFLIVPNEPMRAYFANRLGRSTSLVPPAAPLSIPNRARPAARDTRRNFKIVLKGVVDPSNHNAVNVFANAVRSVCGGDAGVSFCSAQSADALAAMLFGAGPVSWRGDLSASELEEIERDADLLLILLPLNTEAGHFAASAGTAELAEALSRGRPILGICPEESYVGQYLARHDCGVVLHGADYSRIAGAIEALLANPQSRDRYASNALNRASLDFDLQIVQKKFIDALGMVTLPAHLRIPPPAANAEKLCVTLLSSFDILGIQANGFLLHKHFHERGHDSRMLVHVKMSADEAVHEVGTPLQYRINRLAGYTERAVSTRSVLSTLGRGLHAHPKIADADIVNVQLIHAHPFFSLLGLPRLTAKKRVVLSVHDMFLLTGHCIYPMECERWKTGCGSCPDLVRPFRFLNDTTAANWRLKKSVYDRSRLDLIVHSPWMKGQVEQSPLLSRFPLHYIPFGIDERVYRQVDRNAARAQFGIPPDAQVIAFRSAGLGAGFKGTNYIEAALAKYSPAKLTYLLTFDGLGGLDSIRDRYRFVELGWINDQERIAAALNAADLFLMPSIAEAFGLMAIESMACGTPVIVFEGTALPETVDAPRSGIAVPFGDSDALARAIEDCLLNPARLDALRESGLRHVARHHGFKAYGDRHLELFAQLVRDR